MANKKRSHREGWARMTRGFSDVENPNFPFIQSFANQKAPRATDAKCIRPKGLIIMEHRQRFEL
jgi:hypothetical protein